MTRTTIVLCSLCTIVVGAARAGADAHQPASLRMRSASRPAAPPLRPQAGKQVAQAPAPSPPPTTGDPPADRPADTPAPGADTLAPEPPSASDPNVDLSDADFAKLAEQQSGEE